jgi:osmotically-inducible protein OsmY
MKTFATILLLAFTAVACDKGDTTDTTRTTGAGVTAPDNTRTNARDKGDLATPMDQGNSPADLDTTQAIRKAVMSDDSLSSNAKNVKIITNGGVVTLRGPVNSEAEKRNIEAKALAAAGGNRVDDHIDVLSN